MNVVTMKRKQGFVCPWWMQRADALKFFVYTYEALWPVLHLKLPLKASQLFLQLLSLLLLDIHPRR